MGLISFIQDAGASLFGSKEPEASLTQEQKNEKAEVALENVVKTNNIPINNLDVDFNSGVVLISGETDNQEDSEKAAIAVGNIKGIREVDNQIVVLNQEPEATYYTVQSGDSLSKIAKEVYGDAMKYPVIFDSNKPMLKNPDLIYPGQVLRIPPLS